MFPKRFLGLAKESLGEYGSGWGWDYEYAHVFDQTMPIVISKDGHGETIKHIPITYTSNGMVQSTCHYDDMEYTNGQILFSGSVYTLQESCKAHTGNAGNWYSFPTATAGGKITSGNESNSVCPYGWQVVVNEEITTRSWYDLLFTTYNMSVIDDLNIRALPHSFVYSGFIINGISARGSGGYYWTSTTSGVEAYYLDFSSNSIDPQHHFNNKNRGFSVRCVSR